MNNKVIIGLGNPGAKYYATRHNIGFRVVDALVASAGGQWKTKGELEIATIMLNDKQVQVIKPQTFMNDSGRAIPALLKAGITADQLVVVHDELEKPFGTVTVKSGGSHKGHNGLRSIITACGPDFLRVRCGIGRPDDKNEVPDFVLSHFKEGTHQVQEMIDKAVIEIEKLFYS